MQDELLVLSELQVDDREDEVLLIKQIEVVLEKMKKRERVVILVCYADRRVVKL